MTNDTTLRDRLIMAIIAFVALLVMGMAVLALFSARAIPPTGAAAPDLVVTINPLRSTLALVRDLKSQPRLWTGGLIVSWF